MNRRYTTLTTLLGGVLLGSFVAGAEATDVCGPIEADETWSLAGSPYVVTCDVVVRNDATLTVEPGVEVRFDPGTKLWIGTTSLGGGALIADGASGGSILFTSNAPTPAPGDWGGLEFLSTAVGAEFSGDTYLSGSILRSCVVEYAEEGVEVRSYPALIASTIRLCDGYYSGGLHAWSASDTVRVLDCLIEDNTGYAVGGIQTSAPMRIARCVIRNNTGLSGGVDASGIALRIQDSEITGNTALGSVQGGGLTIGGITTEVHCCRIEENNGVAGGITFRPVSYQSLIITETSLAGNTGYAFKNWQYSDIAIPDNWWGTTDLNAIDAMIYDCEDNPTLGCVAVAPVLSGPITPGACEPTTGIPQAGTVSWGKVKSLFR
ncbi:MAG: right-handed parallel beta-helix repeat-containing protein [Candidatus Eisenbacteria bacterium]